MGSFSVIFGFFLLLHISISTAIRHDCNKTIENFDAVFYCACKHMLYVFKGDEYWYKNLNNIESYEQELETPLQKGQLKISETEEWSRLPSNIDTAFTNQSLTYFFKGSHYYIQPVNGKVLDIEYNISDSFPGVPNDLDAAMAVKNNFYFIKGVHIWRFDHLTKIVSKVNTIEGLPLPAEHINAMLSNEVTKNIFYFNNNLYYLHNLATGKLSNSLETADYLYYCKPREPRIFEKKSSLPKYCNSSGIDTIFYDQSSNRYYIIHGKEYWEMLTDRKTIKGPYSIKSKWGCLKPDKIDAVYSKAKNTFFFQNGKIIRYNLQTKKCFIKEITKFYKSISIDKNIKATMQFNNDIVHFVNSGYYLIKVNTIKGKPFSISSKKELKGISENIRIAIPNPIKKKIVFLLSNNYYYEYDLNKNILNDISWAKDFIKGCGSTRNKPPSSSGRKLKSEDISHKCNTKTGIDKNEAWCEPPEGQSSKEPSSTTKKPNSSTLLKSTTTTLKPTTTTTTTTITTTMLKPTTTTPKPTTTTPKPTTTTQKPTTTTPKPTTTTSKPTTTTPKPTTTTPKPTTTTTPKPTTKTPKPTTTTLKPTTTTTPKPTTTTPKPTTTTPKPTTTTTPKPTTTPKLATTTTQKPTTTTTPKPTATTPKSTTTTPKPTTTTPKPTTTTPKPTTTTTPKPTTTTLKPTTTTTPKPTTTTPKPTTTTTPKPTTTTPKPTTTPKLATTTTQKPTTTTTQKPTTTTTTITTTTTMLKLTTTTPKPTSTTTTPKPTTTTTTTTTPKPTTTPKLTTTTTQKPTTTTTPKPTTTPKLATTTSPKPTTTTLKPTTTTPKPITTTTPKPTTTTTPKPTTTTTTITTTTTMLKPTTTTPKPTSTTTRPKPTTTPKLTTSTTQKPTTTTTPEPTITTSKPASTTTTPKPTTTTPKLTTTEKTTTTSPVSPQEIKISDTVSATKLGTTTYATTTVKISTLRPKRKVKYNCNKEKFCFNKEFSTNDAVICENQKIDAIIKNEFYKYVFIEDKYWRINGENVDDAYPKFISESWPGLPNDLDGGFSMSNNVEYFMKDDYYYIYSQENKSYVPKLLSEDFPEIPNNLDAIIQTDGAILFFKKYHYWIWENKDCLQMISDTPKSVLDDKLLLDQILRVTDRSLNYDPKHGLYIKYDKDSYDSPNYKKLIPKGWFNCEKEKPKYRNSNIIKNNEILCKDPKIDAVFTMRRKYYILKDGQYWKASLNSIEFSSPRPLNKKWPELPNKIDAAFTHQTITYFFKGQLYWEYDKENRLIKSGNINQEFFGIPNDVDAAMAWRDQFYFFKGDQYYVYTLNQIYPVETGFISEKFKGIPNNIDAVSFTRNYPNIVTFFKNSGYYEFNMSENEVVWNNPSYPLSSAHWKFFCEGTTHNTINIYDSYHNQVEDNSKCDQQKINLCRNIKIDAIFNDTEQNTFIVSSNLFWKFENHHLVSGYPKYTNEHWPGIPDHIDAAFTYKNNFTFFISGQSYYKFSNKYNRVLKGYPKSIENLLNREINVTAAYPWGENVLFYNETSIHIVNPEDCSMTIKPIPLKELHNSDEVFQWYGDVAHYFKNDDYYNLNTITSLMENSFPPYPRNIGHWWFNCRNDEHGHELKGNDESDEFIDEDSTQWGPTTVITKTSKSIDYDYNEPELV